MNLRGADTQCRAGATGNRVRFSPGESSPDGQPGQATDLVRDAVADGGRDLGEIQAVLDDHVQVDRHVVTVASDRNPLSHALGQPLRAAHGDDAVAIADGLGNDVRDRVARDRDPAERGREHRLCLHADIRQANVRWGCAAA